MRPSMFWHVARSSYMARGVANWKSILNAQVSLSTAALLHNKSSLLLPPPPNKLQFQGLLQKPIWEPTPDGNVTLKKKTPKGQTRKLPGPSRSAASFVRVICSMGWKLGIWVLDEWEIPTPFSFDVIMRRQWAFDNANMLVKWKFYKGASFGCFKKYTLS